MQQIIARRPDTLLLTAVDGSSGVATALSSLPDVILMDINLPGTNGFEALDRLRSAPATAGIPIIALSAGAMPSAIRQGESARFFRYLTKPIRVRELLATQRRHAACDLVR